MSRMMRVLVATMLALAIGGCVQPTDLQSRAQETDDAWKVGYDLGLHGARCDTSPTTGRDLYVGLGCLAGTKARAAGAQQSGTQQSVSQQYGSPQSLMQQSGTSLAPQDEGTSRVEVPLVTRGGVLMVPVSVNGVITLNFVIDSGAADVSLPADVVMTLIRTGSITENDFLGHSTYVLANGTRVPSTTFRIRSLRVGDRTLQNVLGSVAPVAGVPLLGQSFLARFHSWSIDNQRRALILE